MSGHGQLQRSAISSATGAGSAPPRAASATSVPSVTSGTPARATGRPSRRALAALPLATVGAGLVVREVSVAPPDVVFVKGLVEASDGLAAVFAERGGELLLATPHGREAELDELLVDLQAELGARVGGAGGWQ
jgi:hypothetical protein